MHKFVKEMHMETIVIKMKKKQRGNALTYYLNLLENTLTPFYPCSKPLTTNPQQTYYKREK